MNALKYSSVLLLISTSFLYGQNDQYLMSVHEECRADILKKDISRPFPIKQTAPVYPRRGLEQGIEAALLIELSVDERGRAVDPKVVWYDQNPKTKSEIFSRNTIRSVKKFKFRPAQDSLGNNIYFDGYKVFIHFRIDGYENLIPTDNEEIKSLISKNRISDLEDESLKILSDIIFEIDQLINTNELILIDKALLYYLKALNLSRLNGKANQIKENLLLSKSFYEDEYLEILPDGKQVRSITSNKLQTYVGLMLAEAYFKEENWIKVEQEMQEVFFSGTGNKLSKRFYSPLLYQAIASYNNKNWCNSHYAFQKAEQIAYVNNYQIPDSLKNAMAFAKSNYLEAD